MSKEWFKLLGGIAVLAVVVLSASDIKIPSSGQTASVIDAVPTDSTSIAPAEPVPIESASTSTEPISAEPAPPAEPAPVSAEPALAELIEPEGSSEPERPVPAAPTGPTTFFQEILEVFQAPLLPLVNSVPAAPKGVSRLKVFVQDQETLESAVNEWLAVQQGIVIDEFKVDAYDGVTYLIVINYHTSGIGNTPTRIKFFKSEGLDNSIEAPAQAFLSSLNSSQIVRSIIPAIGVAGSVFMFIIYE